MRSKAKSKENPYIGKIAVAHFFEAIYYGVRVAPGTCDFNFVNSIPSSYMLEYIFSEKKKLLGNDRDKCTRAMDKSSLKSSKCKSERALSLTISHFALTLLFH